MSRYGSGRSRWGRYVPVDERRAKADRELEKLRKKGLEIHPVSVAGRSIARTFWGKAWCDHLESFSDFENRLPRGRTYVRNGSVCHLDIARGEIHAIVSGSKLYRVEVQIKALPERRWSDVKGSCAGQIGSILELLQGKLSTKVMTVVTDRDKGLFPRPGEIDFRCSCPDFAAMCKHVAAVLYGVGARLDESPELLFRLRAVDHTELITSGLSVGGIAGVVADAKGGRRRIAEDAMEQVFGIEMAPPERETPSPTSAPRTAPDRPITAHDVRRLRERLGVSQRELAHLLDVTAATVSNWERKNGGITLRARSRAAFDAAVKLTRPQARKRLGR